MSPNLEIAPLWEEGDEGVEREGEKEKKTLEVPSCF